MARVSFRHSPFYYRSRTVAAGAAGATSTCVTGTGATCATTSHIAAASRAGSRLGVGTLLTSDCDTAHRLAHATADAATADAATADAATADAATADATASAATPFYAPIRAACACAAARAATNCDVPRDNTTLHSLPATAAAAASCLRVLRL